MDFLFSGITDGQLLRIPYRRLCEPGVELSNMLPFFLWNVACLVYMLILVFFILFKSYEGRLLVYVTSMCVGGQ